MKRGRITPRTEFEHASAHVRSEAALLVLAACLVIGATPSIAQTAITGYVADETCNEVWPGEERAVLFAIKVRPDGDGFVDLDPDVLFDERALTDHPTWPQIGWASLVPATPGYGIVSGNFRENQPDGDVVFVLILVEGGIVLDSVVLPGSEAGVVKPQVVGAMPGSDAPLIESADDRHLVQWAPVQELDDESSHPSACTRAGAGARGLVIGYNVYCLAEDEYPSPTLADFRRHGFTGFADVRNLDFEVPDVDGTQGSDLDPTDGLTLRNPDGLPDTGDEVLVFESQPSGSSSHWYRVQPVVFGDLQYYDGGVSTLTRDVTAALVDRDDDGVPESADILEDGIIEFTDPSLNGLGLVYDEQILSSPNAGLGGPLTPAPRPREPSAIDLRAVDPLIVTKPSPGMSTGLIVGFEETMEDPLHYGLGLGSLDALRGSGGHAFTAAAPCLEQSGAFHVDVPPENSYFVVVSIDPVTGAVSSAGRDSLGRERTGSTPLTCP